MAYIYIKIIENVYYTCRWHQDKHFEMQNREDQSVWLMLSIFSVKWGLRTIELQGILETVC